MKPVQILFVFGIFAIVFATCQSTRNQVKASSSKQDSLTADRQKWLAQVRNSIKGKEQQPVDSVFSNLTVLSGFPAENLLFAMEAWSKGLGVSCGHCHNTSNFSFDTNPKKKIAREMVIMGNMISSNLKKIDGLSTRPIVNCITCHRGELKPAFRMPAN